MCSFTKFGGFNLFKIESNSKSLLPYKKYEFIDIFLFILLFVINIYLLQKNIRSINDANPMRLFVIDRGLKSMTTLTALHSIYIMLWNVKNSNKTLIIFKNFILFDNEVCRSWTKGS